VIRNTEGRGKGFSRLRKSHRGKGDYYNWKKRLLYSILEKRGGGHPPSPGKKKEGLFLTQQQGERKWVAL